MKFTKPSKRIWTELLVGSIGSLFLLSAASAANTATRAVSPIVYAPGQSITVTLTITPDSTVLSYNVEETPPPGWQLSSTESGASVFQPASSGVSGLIKFPIVDGAALPQRNFTYTATPPAGTSGLKAFSGTASFNGSPMTVGGTINIDIDRSSPTVSITSPLNGTTVSGTLTISATSADNIGVVGVQFKLDGGNLGAEDLVSPYSIPWNTTLAAEGSHSLTAVARDAAGNTVTSSVITVSVDRSSPTVSITSPLTGTTVSGTISIAATATDNIGVVGVQFKLDGGNLGAEDLVSPYSTSWNTTLAAEGSHSLTAVARDAAGNTVTSSVITISVDRSSPTVSITSPLTGTTVSGTISIAATATDNIGVVGVQFKLDGGNLGAEDLVSPYSFSWDTTLAAEGSHNLTAVARDAAGNTVTSSVITISVDRSSPTVSITSPLTGTTLSGTVNVSATATDNIGVLGVQFKLDGVNLGAEDLVSPYSIPWNTTLAAEGSHNLTAVARDAAGNTVTSSVITVSVDRSSPTVSISSPLTGTTLSGTVNVSATATDSVGVVGVQFKLDGVNLGAEDLVSPYSIPWNTTLAAEGSHNLTAVARDAAGNTATSSVITISVDRSSPTVSITSPLTGTTVSGTISIAATATDNIGVVGVQFKLDGVNLGAEDLVSPYSFSWDTTLAAEGSHSLTAVARDAAGNTVTSSVITISVDRSSPTVSITSPLTGTTVSGTISIAATATDNVGVVGVQFKLDGGNLGAEDLVSPYSFSWNTAAVTEGSHSLIAVARDAAGNTVTSSVITVSVDRSSPTVSITSPLTGTTLSGTVNVSATATDSVGVVGVQFKLDGVNLGAEDLVSPYSFSWDTTLAAEGNHNLTAVARDAAGFITTSSVITISVDRSSPTVSITSPLTGTTVSGTISIAATATDNIAVVGVQFILDGVNLGAEDTVSPYSFSWDTTLVADGSHSLTAVARDRGGNATTSSVILVTVGNLVYHPADTDLPKSQISQGEVNLFNYCFKSGTPIPAACAAFPVLSNVDYLNYATKAKAIYGYTMTGNYTYDPSQPAPNCWVPQ